MDEHNGKRRIKIKVKDPLHPTSEPEPEKPADASASPADQPPTTGAPEATAGNQDKKAEGFPADASVESALVDSEKPGEAAQEENAAFADLAARLGEEIADACAPAEEADIMAEEKKQDPESATDPRAAEIDELKAQVAELKEQLARAQAETYNLQQEYSGYVKRSKNDMSAHHTEGQKAVLQVLLGVLDDVQAARDAGDLKGPFEAIAKKLENTLETNFGLTRYGSAGEEFDPNVHEALMAQSGGEGEPSIAQVLQPGYKVGENVLRATKVIVNNPD